MNLSPAWKIVGWLILSGIPIWFLARCDVEVHRIVEVSRSQWEGKSTYEKQFQKYRTRLRWVCVICIVLAAANILFAAIPLLQ
jgi:hypothetical protein